MICLIDDKKQKEIIAKDVLSDLPEWFGLPESTLEYINSSKDLPFWADINENQASGFIVLKETSPYTV